MAFTAKAWPAWLLLLGFWFSWNLGYALTLVTSRDLSTQVRYAGVLLDVFGFALVAAGIRDTRKLFDRPSLMKNFVDWCRYVANAFRRREHPVASSMTVSFEARSPSATFTPHLRPRTIEERITALEKSFSSLEKQMRDQTQRQRTHAKELKSAIQDEKKERASAIARESSRTEQLAVGGLKYEVIGLIWVVFGSLWSNIPDEMAKIIGHFM